MSDALIVEEIRAGDERAVKQLYKSLNDGFNHWTFRNYQLSSHQAKEIYHHSFIILYENLMANRFQSESSSLKTYFYAIAKNKIREMLRANSKWHELDGKEYLLQYEENKDENMLHEENEAVLERFLNKMGDPCRSLLIKYYYQKMSMAQIADSMGYKNEQSAKNQKYKCLQRIRKAINDNKISIKR